MNKAMLAALVAGSCLFGAMPAAAAADRAVRDALALVAAGRNAAAFALLAPLRDARGGDADYDYAFGLAAADSGHRADAIAAFERVLAIEPGHAQARAELARVYAQAGDIDTARAVFDTVVDDPTVPDPVRQRIGRLVRDYDRAIRGGARSLSGFAEAEAGYDGNINTATSLTSITLPLFAFLGPASLSGASTRMGAAFGQAQAGLSATAGLSRQTRVYASALGLIRDNRDDRDFDQAALTGTAGIAHSLANQDVLSLSGQAQEFWLGHRGYRTSYGAIGQFTHRLPGGRALSLIGQYHRFDYRDRLRDADRIAATLSYAGRSWFVGLGGGRERTTQIATRSLGYRFAALQAGVEHPAAANLALLAGLGAEHRDYRGTDPLFLKRRRETQVDASIGLRLALGHGFSVRPRVTWTRSFADIALYDTSRITASIALRAEF